jgi:nitronate monooxygenase
MTLPAILARSLRVPVIGAPMFLVSFPPLVLALCKAGVLGSFPHVNARPSSQLDDWLTMIRRELAAFAEQNPDSVVAPFAVNLVVHRTNTRFETDLEIVVRHKVPVVLTSLGSPAPVVRAVHPYGGIVLCDVVNATHARKAIESGVDGLICVGGGAGGHASSQNSFSLVREIREFWDGCLVLGSSINDGYQVRAAEVLGADLAYIGTRFLASGESNAGSDYKQMILDASAGDIVYTDRLSGVPGNFLLPSLRRAGIDVATLPPKDPDMGSLLRDDTVLWRDVWTAGHGVATIHDIPAVADIVDRIVRAYAQACAMPPSPAMRAEVSVRATRS